MSSFQAGKYWENRLRNRYDERGVGDIGMSRAYNGFLYRVRRRVFRRIVSRLPLDPRRTHVLDIGSGTGVYVREWINWGASTVVGADITATAVDKLRIAFPDCFFFQADIGDRAGMPENSRYDAVSVFDVLFHIVDDDRYLAALENVSSVLRPGGWLLYSDNIAPEEIRSEHYVSRREAVILDGLKANGLLLKARVPMFVLMNDPVRSRNLLLKRWFARVYRLSSRNELIGFITGAILYPLELMATQLIRNGPSTEILICQKQTNS